MAVGKIATFACQRRFQFARNARTRPPRNLMSVELLQKTGTEATPVPAEILDPLPSPNAAVGTVPTCFSRSFARRRRAHKSKRCCGAAAGSPGRRHARDDRLQD